MNDDPSRIVGAREILWATREFADSSSYDNADEFERSATEYFGTQYLDHLKIKTNYRRKHSDLLTPLTTGEAQEFADMYEAMYEKVLDARRFLGQDTAILLEMWLASDDASLSMSYVDVISNILENNPDFKSKYLHDDMEQYQEDCFDTVQWLGGWLRSERVDQQG